MIKLKDRIWHPCSIDIIEHKVIAIIETEEGLFYKLQSINNVGACGKVTLTVFLKQDKTLVFTDLVYYPEYYSGLQDFIEGIYYTNKSEARLAYYKMQEQNALISMDRQEQLYKKSKESYEKVKQIINQIKLDLKDIESN